MEELKLFQSEMFGSVRAISKDGEPWFVATDVCECLGISNNRDAVNRLEEDEKDAVGLTDTMGREQTVTIINEPGLYSLVLGSRKPEAKAFKRWITHDVIPTIRKHGIYATPDKLTEMLSSPEGITTILTKLQQEQQARIKAERQAAELKPKALFADCVSESDGCILIGDLAKLLKQNGMETGQKRLFELLRKDGYLMWNNMPYQRAMEMGLFRVKERTVGNPDGSQRITKTTLVTGKGQVYFVQKYIGGGNK